RLKSCALLLGQMVCNGPMRVKGSAHLRLISGQSQSVVRPTTRLCPSHSPDIVIGGSLVVVSDNHHRRLSVMAALNPVGSTRRHGPHPRLGTEYRQVSAVVCLVSNTGQNTTEQNKLSRQTNIA